MAKSLDPPNTPEPPKMPGPKVTQNIHATALSQSLLLSLLIFMLTLQIWMLLAIQSMQSNISALTTMCSKQRFVLSN
jgi:hypothetical protein